MEKCLYAAKLPGQEHDGKNKDRPTRNSALPKIAHNESMLNPTGIMSSVLITMIAHFRDHIFLPHANFDGQALCQTRLSKGESRAPRKIKNR